MDKPEDIFVYFQQATSAEDCQPAYVRALAAESLWSAVIEVHNLCFLVYFVFSFFLW